MTTPTKVTLEYIENEIAEENYFIVGDVVKSNITDRLKLMTICVLVLKNGFIVTGESSCVSHETFNKEDGERYAKEAAIDKLYPILGFKLLDELKAVEQNQS